MIATGLSYAMTVFGVRYARCGEHIPTLGIGKWLARQWELLSSRKPEQRRFKSAAEAQAWYEWKLKGRALPFITSILMSLALVVVVVAFLRAPTNLAENYEIIFALGGNEQQNSLLWLLQCPSVI